MPTDNDTDSGRVDRRKFLAGLGAGAAAGLAGCGGQGGQQTATETQTEETETETETEGTETTTSGDGEMVEGGRPTIGMAVPPEHLNPLKSSTVYTNYLLQLVLLNGTAINPTDQSFEPWAITEWTLNPGNAGTDSPTIADVKLREDLTFHDGESLTAEDLKFSINYFKQQQPTGTYSAAAHQNISKIEQTGDYTIDIYMSGKDQRWFTDILGYPILPQHIWSGVDDYTKYSPRKADEGLVGAGPFKLTDFNWQNSYTFDAVEFPIASADYVTWLDDGAPFIDGINFQIFGSQNALEQAVLNEEITTGFVSGGFTSSSAIKAQQSDALSVQQSSDSGYNHVSYNMRRVPFDDVAFRQFLNKAFDKTWVVETAYNGFAFPGDYVVPQALKRWRPPEPEKLAGSGYTNDGVAQADLNASEIQSTEGMPDLSYPGNPGTFNMNQSQVNEIRNFLVNHADAKHDYSFGEAQTNITRAPDGKELYVNGQHLTEAHTNNAGEGGQGPLVFSFQPPQEDLYQARYGQQLTGLLKLIGVPVEPLVKTINAQIPTIYVQEDFDFYAMGWSVGTNVTYLAQQFSSAGADLKGNSDTILFNPMGYTGAETLIEKDLQFMDFSKRVPYVKQIAAEIYRDAPTNVTDVSQLLEPTNKKWQGWITGLGTAVNQMSFLNIRQSS